MKRNQSLKKVLFIAFVFCSVAHQVQAQKIIKYYDSAWVPSQKSNAFYYTEFVKNGSVYDTYSYWVSSNKLNVKASFYDTSFSRPAGLLLRYYETGQTQDSTYYYDDFIEKNTFHYYPNGKLWVHYTYDKRSKKAYTEAFNPKGNPIDDFIYNKEAEYPEGAKGWQEFLNDNLNREVPIKKNAPNGTYTTVVRLTIDETGKVISIAPETSYGYGMEEEVMRVIKKSPRWTPAIILGKRAKAYRRQPVTFVIAEK